jgi:Phage related protein
VKNTADFLDALRVKLNLPSDGQLADYLGMHRQHVSRYRTLAGTFDDAMSMKVAGLLDVDPAYVVASMHAQRAKRSEEKKLWERIATLTSGIAAALVIVSIVPVALFNGGGLIGVSNGGDVVYYVKSALLYHWWILAPLILFALYHLPAKSCRPS